MGVLALPTSGTVYLDTNSFIFLPIIKYITPT